MQRTLKVKRLHPDAVLPKRARHDDTGADLVATSITKQTDSYIQYGTGIAVEMDGEDTVDIEVRARSGVFKQNLILANGVGTVDRGYRGEILLTFYKQVPDSLIDLMIQLVEPDQREAVNALRSRPYQLNERIGQLKIGADVDWRPLEVDELTSSERGTGGHGSTGR